MRRVLPVIPPSAPLTVTAANVGKVEIKGSAEFSFAAGLHDVVLQGFSSARLGAGSPPSNRATGPEGST